MTTNLSTVRLGTTGPAVSRLALGAMGMSGMYGTADDAVSIATVHAALDSGANLIDTGDFYGMGHNELLIRQALAGRRREDILLSVKYGALRGPDNSFGGVDTRPAATKNFLAYSLQRLGTDYIDIYRPARLDPAIPIEETIGGLADLVQAGYIRHIGLSEVGAQTLRRAAAVHPIVDLQIEYSLVSRGIEAEILPVARELGIGVTAYGVLSRGLLSDSVRPGQQFAPSDFRAHSPRFQGENLDANLCLVDALAKIAAEHQVSVAQLAIAWVLSRGTDIVPLVGARKPERWAEAVAAADIQLSEAELAIIEAAVPADQVAGGRYAPAQMAMLDSER
ncbi:aldo/keto reductase [Nocardia aurantiaca]|uniref:Aldo/keto reductase n=1 Tax=Nocardia aurantiaca TaxID=2675850 RepID=A0A6I3LCF2_9NOCA|nr:aldo/keto reductase [Nocardia aurantiaca]MTE17509.1 aldo/keto reductase [Nocardia aurantiaca]